VSEGFPSAADAFIAKKACALEFEADGAPGRLLRALGWRLALQRRHTGQQCRQHEQDARPHRQQSNARWTTAFDGPDCY